VWAPTQKTHTPNRLSNNASILHVLTGSSITRRVVATLTIRGTAATDLPSSTVPQQGHLHGACAYKRVIRVGFCSRRGSNTDPGLKDLIQYSRGGQKAAGECVSSHTTVKLMNCVLPLSHATGRDNEHHFGSSTSPRSTLTFDTIEGHVSH
jgi:hypothetical protein